MTNISIVYYSGFGHTKKVAEHVAMGAKISDNTVVHLIEISKEGQLSEADWNHLHEADTIIFGTPTYMGNVAGPFKMFVDQTARIFAMGKWKDKYAAGFTNSGSLSGDKQTTLFALVTLACQHGMIWISGGVPSNGKDISSINRVGGTIGLMTQSDDASPEETPKEGDLETARLFGTRVAEFTLNGRK